MVEKEKHAGGRPTDYRDEYPEQAFRFALLGMDNEKMAEAFEINITTFKRWMKTIPQFKAAIKNGKAIADAAVASNLYRRAMGFRYQEVSIKRGKGKIEEKLFLDETGELDEELVKQDEVTITIKEILPDVTAQIFWLKNRRPDEWRDKKEINGNLNVRNYNFVDDEQNEPLSE